MSLITTPSTKLCAVTKQSLLSVKQLDICHGLILLPPNNYVSVCNQIILHIGRIFYILQFKILRIIFLQDLAILHDQVKLCLSIIANVNTQFTKNFPWKI